MMIADIKRGPEFDKAGFTDVHRLRDLSLAEILSIRENVVNNPFPSMTRPMNCHFQTQTTICDFTC